MDTLNKDKIEVGDEVRVDFNGAQLTLCHRAIVKGLRYNDIDPWIFKDCDSGTIHYVSENCTVTLLKKAEQLKHEDLPF